MQWMIRCTSSMFSGKMGQSFQFTEVTTPCLNCRWLYSSISTRFCTSVWPTVFIYFVTAGRVEPIQYPGYVTSVISCLASYHLCCNSTSNSLITSFVFLFDANQYLKLGNKSGDLNVCYQITLTEAPPTRIRFCPQRSFFHRFGLPSTSIRWPKTHLFKTNLFKTLSSVASLGNVSFSFTRGQKKTQVFD